MTGSFVGAIVVGMRLAPLNKDYKATETQNSFLVRAEVCWLASKQSATLLSASYEKGVPNQIDTILCACVNACVFVCVNL